MTAIALVVALALLAALAVLQILAFPMVVSYGAARTAFCRTGSASAVRRRCWYTRGWRPCCSAVRAFSRPETVQR